jgi:hypothetical protein
MQVGGKTDQHPFGELTRLPFAAGVATLAKFASVSLRHETPKTVR